MKIESAESLSFSWLRHVKKCQVVQMNWKPSPYWDAIKGNDHETFIERAKKFFTGTPYHNLFKDNASGSQLVRQAEIDVVGIQLENQKINELFAIDTAFHEKGLNYGSKGETVNRVVKKMVRTSMVIEYYFRDTPCEIIFASPKINKGVLKLLEPAIVTVQEFADKHSLSHHRYDLITNERFEESILRPVLNLSSNVADTSELFLRSYQLLLLFPRSFNIIEFAEMSETLKTEAVPINGSQASKALLRINLNPSSKEEFKKALLRTKRAEIKIFYQDGTTRRSEWRADRFKESSLVLGNLRSRTEFKQGTWQKLGIKHVDVSVIGE